MDDLREKIRNIPDFPQAGIQFKDITPLLGDPGALRTAVTHLVAPFRNGRSGVTAVAGMEARGFVFGALAAWELGASFVPLRKPGKLPAATHRVAYDLEYGQAALEVHTDAIGPGDRVLLVDDLIATGGTAKASCELIEQCGAEVTGCAFVIELSALKGRDRLAPYTVHAVLEF